MEAGKNTKNVMVSNQINMVRKIIHYLFYFILLINISSCKTYKLVPEIEDTPQHDFDVNLSGDIPNYSEIKYEVQM